MSDLVRFLSLALAFFAVSGLVIALFVGRNCLRSDPESAIAEEIKDIPPAFNLADSQLVQAYSDDEESARATYNGQVDIVRGRLLGVSDGANHLRFQGNNVWSVRCFISEIEADNIRNRWDSLESAHVIERVSRGLSVGGSSGRKLLMKGKVEGVNDKHLSVDMRGCTLQDSP